MMQVGFRSDKGMVRGDNEDALFVVPAHNFFIVADGVGGHKAGALASRTAVTTMAKYVKKTDPFLCTKDQLSDYFTKGLQKANDEIIKIARSDMRYRGMATTSVLLYVRGEKGYLMNVGDSRGYLIREEGIAQITEDHTVTRELIREGTITKAEADVHPMHHMITRALGGEDRVDPDFYETDIRSGDIFLLCSDGLYGELSDEEIRDIVISSQSMNEVCNLLVNAANQKGGRDNVTALCVRISSK